MPDHEKPSNRLLHVEEWSLLVDELGAMSNSFVEATIRGSVTTSDMEALWEQMREAVRKYDALRARPVTVMVVDGAHLRHTKHAHWKYWCEFCQSGWNTDWLTNHTKDDCPDLPL